MLQGTSELRQEFASKLKAVENSFLELGDADRYLKDHTELVDELVRQVSRPFLEEETFAVLATAGYGRREQFPQSDVDLLIVHDFSRKSQAEGAIGPFLNQLWDCRLVLGHQVWSREDFGTLSMDDLEFVLALFNARYIAGDKAMAEAIMERILPDFIASHHQQLIDEIVRLVRQRHEKSNNTIFQLEPDVKEAPGGLRDHLAATWLERLVGDPPFLAHSAQEIESAHRMIKRLRILIHLQHGRTDNRLTHELQEQLAPQFGFHGRNIRSDVESLMKKYFLNARVISGFCSSMVHAACPHDSVRPLQLEDLPSLDTAAGILEAFSLTENEGRPLSAKARATILKSVPGLETRVRYAELSEQVSDLMRPRGGLFRLLSEMYQLGVLELLFPEFSTIKARMIRDFYHKYTVDEHTLIAIKAIEDLATGESSADQRFAAVLRDSVHPELLVLALLLHDVGKSQEGMHAKESARMATRALRRFRFDRQAIDQVNFLIREHLSMSAVIFRRDLEDDQIINRFADLVQDPERLRLLTLLTYADIKAVAPGTLNDWKKDLLWQLYLETYRKLTLEYGEEKIEEEHIGDKLIRKLEPDLDPEDFERFLEGFPIRYLRTTPPDVIYEHCRMSSRISADNPVETLIKKRKTFYELCVITPDRKRLFAKIVGLLSYFEMNILRGFAFANRRQTILDIFHFSDERRAFRHAEERDRFLNLLHRTVADEVSVQTLIRGKEESPLFRRTTPRFAPSLYFEDEHSERYTIMEIIAPDAIGLLYRISTEIAALACDIDFAIISTEGDKAVDVFYLSHQGGKLSEESKSNLTERIKKAIEQS